MGLDAISKIPDCPTHAVKKRDNWDGEGDVVFLFAFEYEGELFYFETGKPLLEYDGDSIIKSWPLN